MKKLFAGQILRRRREELSLPQALVARRLGISPSYLNQIESDQRPLTAAILVEVTRVLKLQVADLYDDGPERLAANLREMLSDPLFEHASVSGRELKAISAAAPHLVRAMLDLHSSYRRMEERYRGLDDALRQGEGPIEAQRRPFAFDEVRDFFHFMGNYCDALDRSAEALAERLWGENAVSYQSLADYSARELGARVIVSTPKTAGGPISRYDPAIGALFLDGDQEPATQKFLLACHIAARTQHEKIDELAGAARFKSPASAEIAKLALANYFASALVMPYARFSGEARAARHDVERLSRQFGVSIEQVCHRFSTLQRPGREGAPFYFLRVDRAGNITKRHSATRFQFARYGGACPLWNIHEAFERPNHFLVQVAEMPDGVRYLSVARSIAKKGGSFGSPQRNYAIGFGCEIDHAQDLVYSDAIDLRSSATVAKIGVACRVCERQDCLQRAVPPLDAAIEVDANERGMVPYRLRSGG
ncbi:transcriptional regulator, XRE family [Methylocella silvestris BL2]|uniref:Transcriptional regulator, XRE family n=1 Tax=Methylocella silvestris (strain DSM 15510 / CIP 108128 / LMG 27833 / NCIMB 13906 / BL2) TaxID=395965 RepID=B8EJH8_METSB|nr:short-chain fatty acyl-CoA regulator family protein [Methylocella silvestris]ACK52670.1 transcriptional regulator, XRE family [Methylocella silvestris BL2]